MSLNVKTAKQFAQNLGSNTSIGGVASVLYSPYLLSQALNINVNRIDGFRIVGDDVQCRIKGDYNLVSITGFPQNLVTHYIDVDNLVKSLSTGMFDNAINLHTLQLEGVLNFTAGGFGKITYTKLEHLNFPLLTQPYGNISVTNNDLLKNFIAPNAREMASGGGGDGWLRNNVNLELVDLRSMRFIGRKYVSNPLIPSRGNTVFLASGKVGTILKVHQNVISVPEDGGLDVNVAYAKNTRGWIIELYDNDGNYVSTLP